MAFLVTAHARAGPGPIFYIAYPKFVLQLDLLLYLDIQICSIVSSVNRSQKQFTAYVHVVNWGLSVYILLLFDVISFDAYGNSSRFT